MSTPRPQPDDKLLDLLYGEVLPEDAEALQALVNTDPVLRERLEAWTSVRRAMATLPEPEPDPQVHYNILRAARQQAAPAEAPKGFFAWLSSLTMNPAFAGLGLMVLAGGALLYFSRGYQDSEAPAPAAPTALERAVEAPAGSAADQAAPASNAPGLAEDGKLRDGLFAGKDRAQNAEPVEEKAAEEADEGEAPAGLDKAGNGALARAEQNEKAKALSAKGTDAFGGDGDARDGVADTKTLIPPVDTGLKDMRSGEGGEGRAAKRKRAPARPAPATATAKKADKKMAFDLAGEVEKEPAFAPPPPAPPAEVAPQKPAAFPKEEVEESRGGGGADRVARNRGEPAPVVTVDAPLAEAAGAEDEDANKEAAPRRATVDEVAVFDDALADPAPSADDDAAPEAAPVPVQAAAAAVGGAGGMAPPRPEPDARPPAAVRRDQADEPAATRQPATQREADADGGGVPPALRQARAARQRGDHAAAVEAYQRYFSSNRGHDQFAMSMIEAARSYEVLGDTARALQLYRLAASSDDPTVRALARQRIAALEAVRKKADAPRAERPAAVMDDAEALPAEPVKAPADEAPKE